MKKALKYLKKNINDTMTLPEMVDVFENMCQIPIDTDDDTFLLDSCCYDPTFSGNIVQIFSLVRQIPDKKGEYYQLRLEITLETKAKEFSFSDPIWSDFTEEGFFVAVKSSEPYLQAINEKIIKTEIHLDKT